MKHCSYHEGRRSPYCATIYCQGKRTRKFFRTERERDDYVKAHRKTLREYGTSATLFTPEMRADYANALEIAKEKGFSLLYPFVVALAEKGAASMPPTKEASLLSAFEEYYSAKEKQGRSASTLHDIDSRVRRFAATFNAIPFSELTQRHVEEWCTSGDLSPRTCRNNFTVVASFLRWAKRQGYHSLELDFDKTAFLPRELKKVKPVFSFAEVAKMLDVLQDTPKFRRYIPFYALQLFCGIRRAEAERMKWCWVDIEAKEIRLPAEITKTGDEHILRPPFLPETVFAWLKPFVPTVKTTQFVFPTDYMRREIEVQIGKWERNGMRHTFATMHVSLHGDPAKTAVLLRHRNQQRLWQNYLARLVPEEEAKKYFELKPKTD